ncbi:MAG: PEP-CTERM sorting domain-containing protein [Betaproteobacteria bacterium]
MNLAAPGTLDQGCMRAVAAAVALLWMTGANAETVYSNDFETPATAFAGLTASGTLGAGGLSTTSLPTDGGTLASPNQSTWLGRLGYGIGKASADGEVVTLALGGLTAGKQYSLAFDLLVGASWDGSAISYGADQIAVSAQSGVAADQLLLDATFANGQQGINYGADSRQSYSDATPLGGDALSFNRFAGADASFSNNSGDYSGDYSIYSFGRGTGNPMLTFTADDSTASLVFKRLPTASGDSGDEYWALDNITVASVAAVPEPGTSALMLAGLGLLGYGVRRRSSKA